MKLITAETPIRLLEEALRLVKEDIAGTDLPQSHVYRDARERHLERCMDRLDNLCTLAHELVREEYLRVKDDWPEL